MKHLLLFLLLIVAEVNFASEFVHPFSYNLESKQKFDKQYMFAIEDITLNDLKLKVFSLSDGSKWESIDSMSQADWNLGDRVLIRWENDLVKYFLHNVTKDPLLTWENPDEVTEFVTMTQVPALQVISVQENIITLSDGNSFQCIPVKGRLQVGNRIIVSLNEDIDSASYPYFLIAYHYIINPKTQLGSWKTPGEVKAQVSFNL